jgi:glycoside hydrolase-like protein
MIGLDANTPLGSHAECIVNEGFTFVARYYKNTDSCLTRAEALALSAAGLNIVAVVERGSPTSADYFSHARGLADGAFALRKARDQIRQPAGSPVYFAVDYDASLHEVAGVVAEYFTGVHEAFGSGEALYPIGVYGSGLVCSHLLVHTPVTYAWLSMSKGWRGGHTFKGWNLNQTVGSTVCGIPVDLDESAGHGGGFRVS